jgi:hypothetical protein
MRKIPLITLLMVLLVSITALTQVPFPEAGHVFRDDRVPRIDILIPQASLNAIFDPANAESDFHHLADFFFDDGEIRDTITDIGFRLRGNTSRYSQKKSFKVSFNTYEPGRKWHGLEKLNLNGEHNDPSVIRSKVCWDLLRDFEVPAPRSNHIDLYINNQYFGIYINVEHVDEEFVDNRFGNNDGNLYKCLWPADLIYRGSNPNSYKYTSGDRRAYDLVTNTEADDYSDIAHFIDILNNTPVSERYCELDQVINLDIMIRSIAFDILSGNWDGPLYNKNNFYLYRNTATGKFEYIPYDLDNTFGIDWFGKDWATRNVYTWANNSEPRPLFYQLLEIPELRDRLSVYLEEFIEKYYNEEQIFPALDRIKAMITNSVIADPFRPLDYGFSFQDYLNSYNKELDANHVKYGLKPFITNRLNATLNQLEHPDYAPIITEVRDELDFSSASLIVQARVIDQSGLSSVDCCYTVNGSQPFCMPMTDDGQYPDGTAGDGLFTTSVPIDHFSGTYTYYIRSFDQSGHFARYPVCREYQLNFGEPSGSLKVNEFMADNEETIADNYGEYEDWVELFNAGPDSLFLGDKYITDDRQEPLKWNLPNKWIRSGEFLLLWADDDEEDQGENHLGFKLSKEGEFIGVYDLIEGETVLLDGLDFGEQPEDISLGRYPDGTGDFGFMEPTPGGPNVPTRVDETVDQGLHIFPNPSTGHLRIDSDHPVSQWSLFNTQGKLIRSENEYNNRYKTLIINNLNPGLYFLKMEIRGAVHIRKLVVR